MYLIRNRRFALMFFLCFFNLKPTGRSFAKAYIWWTSSYLSHFQSNGFISTLNRPVNSTCLKACCMSLMIPWHVINLFKIVLQVFNFEYFRNILELKWILKKKHHNWSRFYHFTLHATYWLNALFLFRVN